MKRLEKELLPYGGSVMKKKVITALTLATALSSLFGGTAFASTAHYNDATQAAFAISYKKKQEQPD